ncbi:MAG: hypothetical protein IJV35_07250 [Neisseriaceae bacterium]|nr:hypothetical protein [Neisseriaceae bacterium]
MVKIFVTYFRQPEIIFTIHSLMDRLPQMATPFGDCFALTNFLHGKCFQAA